MDLKKELLQALQEADVGDWNAAHDRVQDLEHPLASWIHANLHREEGDDGNARYWYGRAGRPFATATLQEERATIAAAIKEEPWKTGP